MVFEEPIGISVIARDPVSSRVKSPQPSFAINPARLALSVNALAEAELDVMV
jgi:hypothetical protein